MRLPPHKWVKISYRVAKKQKKILKKCFWETFLILDVFLFCDHFNDYFSMQWHYFCIVQDFSTPARSLSFWDVNICKTCWGTEVANSFSPYIARLWNSVPAYCFPFSYNLHLFKGNISMHLASSTITWKPTNKNTGNFIRYPKSKLINWFEKWCPVFDISHIIWSPSRCNCIYFGTLL